MKLPRVRFSERRMMVAVAALAFRVPGWIERRRAGVETLATAHWAEGFGWASYGKGMPETNPRGFWHWAMSNKYHWAARYPWLPVATDPPEPG